MYVIYAQQSDSGNRREGILLRASGSNFAHKTPSLQIASTN